MKIVIIGGGRLGTELIASLAPEGHDLSLIDHNEEVVERLGGMYDILAMSGNGVIRQIQEEAGVNKADLLIAASESDEQNMLCCLTARKLGAKHTIARVRNPEYYAQLEFLVEDLGLSMYINPEEAAAKEIAQAIRLPGVQKAEMFAGNLAELIELHIPPESKADGLTLLDFPKVFNSKALICAVRRNGEVTIPSGKFKLLAGDHITLTAAPNELSKIFAAFGHKKQRIRRVMIVGDGLIAFYLAQILSENQLSVTIVESNHDRCVEFASMLPKVKVICGDGTDQDFLLQEGLSDFDAMAVLTSDDENNIIIAMYAETLGVSKVAIRLGRKGLFPVAERVLNGIIVNPQVTAASRIIQYVRVLDGSPGGTIEALYKIADGSAEAVEFLAWRESQVIGIPLRDLDIKPGILVACIIRNNASIIPGGNDSIRAGDRVVIITATHKLGGLDDILADSIPAAPDPSFYY